MTRKIGRRGFVAGSAVALAGCLEGLEAEPGGGNDRKNTVTADDVTVTLELPEYVVTTASKFSRELNSATAIDELDGILRPYVEEAVGKEDDDATVEVSEEDAEDAELLNAVRDVRYVRDGRDVYEIGYELPVYVVTGTVADADPEDVDEDRVVGMTDDILRALGPDNQQIISMANSVVERDERRRFSGTGEYRTPSIGEELERFLDETDYLGVPTGDDPTAVDEYVELDVRHDDPGEPYEISVRRMTDEETFGVETTPVEELEDELERVARVAVERGYRADSLPDGYDEVFARRGTDDEERSYYRVDDEAHAVLVHQPDYDGKPVSVSLELTEDGEESENGEGAAEIEISLTNRADTSVSVFSGAPAPFGVLRAARVVNPDAEEAEKEFDRGEVLWSDAYEESGYVHETEHGLAVNDIGLTTELSPDETVSETYEVDGFEPGRYEVRESVSGHVKRGVLREDRETFRHPYTVVVEVEQ